MALWAERQVKRDLGIVVHQQKPESFDKLFETPPHVEYIAREAKTAKRLRRLMGTNVVELTNCVYMDKLEHMTVRAYREDLQVRMDERAHQAEQLAHLQLWESVLRGQSDVPPEKLDDPCMRQVRQHQLKIEALHQLAIKLGTTVQRVAAMPHVWSEPSHFKSRGRKKRSKTPPAFSQSERSRQTRTSPLSAGSHGSSAPSQPISVMAPEQEARGLSRGDSWQSKQMLVRMSEEARDRRSRSAGSTPSTPATPATIATTASPASGYGYQYRRLTGDSGPEICPSEKLPEKLKIVPEPSSEGCPCRKDRRLSRVNPPPRRPVVFPAKGPRFVLLSCDLVGGRSVMKPLGSTDFIIPRYFRPRAPDLLRAAKTLDDLYHVGNSIFDVPYPPMDNHDWKLVLSSRAEKKAKQAQEVSPVHAFRLVK